MNYRLERKRSCHKDCQDWRSQVVVRRQIKKEVQDKRFDDKF